MEGSTILLYKRIIYFGKKEDREGTCPVPSHTPGNEYDGMGGKGKWTRVLSGIRRKSVNFTGDGMGTNRMKNSRISSPYKKRRILLFLYIAISFIRKLIDLKYQEKFSKASSYDKITY